jgi:hypothetical protein
LTVPTALQVAAPVLAYQALPGGYAPLEKPLGLAFPPVAFPDGSPVTADDVQSAQALVVRRTTSAASPEVWDAAAKSWKALVFADLLTLTGIPLLPPRTGPEPWEGMLIAIAEKEASGLPQIAPAVGSFPEYRVRGAFRAQRAGQLALGVGPESAPVAFVASAEAQPFKVELAPDPEAATSVRFVLKRGGQALGSFEIDASAGSSVVGVSKFDGAGNLLARVELRDDGGIRLAPAPGKNVVIAGDLVVDRVSYVRNSDGGRRDL